MIVTVRLTKAQAKALLTSEGLGAGGYFYRSQALKKGLVRILDAIQEAWNAQVDEQ